MIPQQRSFPDEGTEAVLFASNMYEAITKL